MGALEFIFHQVFFFFYYNKDALVVKRIYVYIYMILDGKTSESNKSLVSYQLNDAHNSVSAGEVSPTLVPCNFDLF